MFTYLNFWRMLSKASLHFQHKRTMLKKKENYDRADPKRIHNYLYFLFIFQFYLSESGHLSIFYTVFYLVPFFLSVFNSTSHHFISFLYILPTSFTAFPVILPHRVELQIVILFASAFSS